MVKSHYLYAMFTCLFIFGCSDKSPELSGSFRAKVVYLDRDEVSKNGGEPVYKVGTQDFSFLKDLSNLDGDYLKIVRGGTLSVR